MAIPYAKPAYSVGELTAYIRSALEGDPLLRGIAVSGEVSNLTYHGSGHIYFSLKDAEAQLSCAFFKNYNQQAPRLKNGDKLSATGDISVYPPRGGYQLLVKSVRMQGKGDLFQQFQALKEKLSEEGLFDAARKKPVPVFARKIALITSPTGAALKDMLRTFSRRFPAVRVVVIPAQMQGDAAVGSVTRALGLAGQSGADVVILARGGGSIEDLWTFNEEAVARAIVACPLPVVTGIGHETDFTIADFVADARASTPTAAAEACTPDRFTLQAEVGRLHTLLGRNLKYALDFRRQQTDEWSYRLGAALRESVAKRRQEAGVEALHARLLAAWEANLTRARQEIALLNAQLHAHNPAETLKKGFSMTFKDGQAITTVNALQPGDRIETRFADGSATSVVQ